MKEECSHLHMLAIKGKQFSHILARYTGNPSDANYVQKLMSQAINASMYVTMKGYEANEYIILTVNTAIDLYEHFTKARFSQFDLARSHIAITGARQKRE